MWLYLFILSVRSLHNYITITNSQQPATGEHSPTTHLLNRLGINKLYSPWPHTKSILTQVQYALTFPSTQALTFPVHRTHMQGPTLVQFCKLWLCNCWPLPTQLTTACSYNLGVRMKRPVQIQASSEASSVLYRANYCSRKNFFQLSSTHGQFFGRTKWPGRQSSITWTLSRETLIAAVWELDPPKRCDEVVSTTKFILPFVRQWLNT